MKKLFLVLLLTSYGHANMSPEGFERFPNNYFVETGTYLGQGIGFALRAGFPVIHSVEIDHNFAMQARAVFARYPNVHIWEGDSGKMLWDVIKGIEAPITFWLDGHNGFPDPKSAQKNTPLMEELEQIKWHPVKTHTIIIDDMHCCGTLLFDFLTRDDIVRKIMEINSAYEITYVPGGDAGEYPVNIMVARVP